MTARYVVGDVFDTLATLEPGSVDLVLTSPPFLALRSYLPASHPDKHREIGSEATPAAFIDTLLDVVEACDRVLAPHGSICVELGDTYAGSAMSGQRYDEWPGQSEGYPRRETDKTGAGWPLDKSLCGIPQLFMLSLAYGRNMLRPERQTPRWRVRNVVAWCRPNPPVGALADKYRPATSYLTVACKSRGRYFDLDAVRTVNNPDRMDERFNHGSRRSPGGGGDADPNAESSGNNPAGAPPLDWWQIPTQPYPGAHYATWPQQLCVTPIKSMCPQRVCTVCGQPSRRIVSEPEYVPSATYRGGSSFAESERVGDNVNQWVGANGAKASVVRQTDTVGWSDCGHNSWRPGLVLDPFAGSGTTLQVATGHGLAAIGIDLDPANAQLAVDRVGPLLLTVDDTRAWRTAVDVPTGDVL